MLYFKTHNTKISLFCFFLHVFLASLLTEDYAVF